MCISYHENPGWTLDEPETLRTVVPVYLADLLANHLDADWDPLKLPFHPIEDPGWGLLGLGIVEAQEMVEEVREGEGVPEGLAAARVDEHVHHEEEDQQAVDQRQRHQKLVEVGRGLLHQTATWFPIIESN